MRLTEAESKQLERESGSALVVWRFAHAVAGAEVGRCYSTRGMDYTILSVRLLTRQMVREKESQKMRLALWTLWIEQGGDYDAVWRVEIARGDFSDKPRFMQPTGRRGGDYTHDPRRGMAGEAEALSARELAALTTGSK